MAIEPGKELMWKAITNTITEEEKHFLNQWLEADPKNKLEFEKLKSIHKFTAADDIDQTDPEQSKMDEFDSNSTEGIVQSIWSNYKIVLFILIALLVLLAMYNYLKN